ncbi:unnamed protein product [Heligmosomoides polygyrus]|uniref:CCHC-type domain-containing protein n=1 Tax=Heligmosomoides polygyrus TaxID=6339 RepID=A0A183GKM9_HELPZ|nr:unnamed protein product [Heligmosomoides polygyrus]
MSSQEAQPVVIDDLIRLSRAEYEELQSSAAGSIITESSAAAAAPRITSPVCMEAELFQSTSSASANSKPVFSKPGLEKQFEFNSEVLSLIAPIAVYAPENFRTKESLMKAITLLTQRNELLTLADKDPDVWQHFDTYSKAQSMKISHPLLADYLMNKKAEEKKTHPKASAWKRSVSYGQRTSQPFRAGGATWALAPPSDFQFNPYPQQQRMQYPGAGFKAPSRARQMCFDCGRFGHLKNECRSSKSNK